MQITSLKFSIKEQEEEQEYKRYQNILKTYLLRNWRDYEYHQCQLHTNLPSFTLL